MLSLSSWVLSYCYFQDVKLLFLYYFDIRSFWSPRVSIYQYLYTPYGQVNIVRQFIRWPRNLLVPGFKNFDIPLISEAFLFFRLARITILLLNTKLILLYNRSEYFLRFSCFFVFQSILEWHSTIFSFYPVLQIVSVIRIGYLPLSTG